MALSAAVSVVLVLLLTVTGSVLLANNVGGHSGEVEATAFSFTQSVYRASIPENSPGRSYIQSPVRMGIQLSANRFARKPIDVRFRIVAGDRENFFKAERYCVDNFCFLMIRTRTNHQDVLNRERKSEFKLKVRAFDRSSKRSRLKRQQAFAQVVIEIEDENDLSAWFDSSNYNFEIGEDASLHSVVARVHAEDADTGMNREIFYSFVTTSQYFYIQPTTGEILLLRKLSFKHRPEFKLKVRAQDRGNRRLSSFGLAKVTIRVLPVNLHDPVMQINHVDQVIENSFMNIYAVVKVSDDDEGIHGEIDNVRITNGDSDLNFKIIKGTTKNEFFIGLHESLDREKAPYGYNLTLNATDKGVPSRWSSHSVRVRLMDFNDHTPSFAKQVYTAEIKETVLPNTHVLQLRASDTDWGVNAEVHYFITSGNHDNVFRLNSVTGLLTTVKPLDAEDKTFYALTVSALDQGYGNNRRQGSAKVKISVLDENDNAPTMRSRLIKVEIDENQAQGLLVTRLEAQDADQGDNSFLSYTIINDEDIPFGINHFDGSITTTQVLDYETQKRLYLLKIRVSDWGKPYRRQIEALVEISVRDVNDNRPQFERIDCSGRITRTLFVGSEIMTVSAIDWDENASVKYRITDGNHDKCFSLDEYSGLLSVSCNLTDTKEVNRRLSIMANDGEHFSEKCHIDLTIVESQEVLDGRGIKIVCRDSGAIDKHRRVLSMSKQFSSRDTEGTRWQYLNAFVKKKTNKNTPEILNEKSSIEIYEDAALYSQVLEIVARDKDFGFDGLLIFTLICNESDSTFSIDVDSGNVSVAGLLDRERNPTYRLNVTVCDLGQPQLCSSRNFTVVILDVNDNAPVFTKSSVKLYFAETRNPRVPIWQLNATDADEGPNGQVKYRIESGDSVDFSVDPSTGVIQLTRALDRERQQSYDLVFAAFDCSITAPLVSHFFMYVEVLDVNDNPPVFSRSLYLTRALEDLPVNTVLLAVQAYDPDHYERAEPVRYSLINDEVADGFSIDSYTGSLRLILPLDFERRQVYNLTVVAHDLDAPRLSASTRVVILVEDVDENYFRPRFVRPVVTGYVQENRPVGSHVMTVTAVDNDVTEAESTVVYAIRGGSGLGFFSVNNTGDIVTARVFDRETSAGYWLTVVASDSAAAPKHSTLEVFVTIGDQNDNVPLAGQPVYEAHVPEHSPAGTWVTQVTADDLDWRRPETPPPPQFPSPGNPNLGWSKSSRRPRSRRLSYSISAGDPQALFHIGRYSGIVKTSHRQLDREIQDSFLLQVKISDGEESELLSITFIRVTVLDMNDCGPKFPERFQRLDVPYGPLMTSNDLKLTQVIAFDDDLGENGTLLYSLLKDESGGSFGVDSATGVVSAVNNNNIRAGSKYRVTIGVSDGGVPALTASTDLLISVHHVDKTWLDETPLNVSLTPARVLLVESDTVGHLVAIAQTNAKIALFNIEDGNVNGMFRIDRNGAVLLARPLDCHAASPPEFRLNVSVSDGVRFVYASLSVGVLDAGDHCVAPRFVSTEFTARVSELTQPGQWLPVALETSSADLTSGSPTQTRTQSGGGRSSLVYQLEFARSPRSLNHFRLDPSSGRIQLIQALDREVTTEHVLIVSVRDHSALPNHRDYARVLVTVLDENDHAPSFSSQLVRAHVLETASVGSHVITVLAFDADHGDNGQLDYSIVAGNVASVFTIDRAMGVITLARQLASADLVAEYMLTVRAVDGGARFAELLVNVVVAQPDNAPPQLDQAEYFVELAEDADVGSHVLTLTSRCRSAVSYRLVRQSGTEGGAAGAGGVPVFVLNPGSGVLTLADRLDYEHQTSYNLTVQAISSIGKSSLAWVLVHVLDVNDNAPRFTNTTYTGVVSEAAPRGSVVWSMHSQRPLVLTAEDIDSGRNGQLVYTAVGQSIEDLIEVDQYTGSVRVNGKLDYERQPEIQFSVSVSDRGRPHPLQAWPAANVILHVTNVDDEPPVFDSGNCTFTVLLPTYSGVIVGQIKAHDADTGNIRYWMNSTASSNNTEVTASRPFAINPMTGVIRVTDPQRISHSPPNSSLTMTTGDSYFLVSASDGVRTATTSVQVKTSVAPSSGLSFSSDVFYAAVYENSTAVEMVLTLTVRGAYLNEPLYFTALTESKYFTVDSTSGVVHTTGEPVDRETATYHVLVIQVSGVDISMPSHQKQQQQQQQQQGRRQRRWQQRRRPHQLRHSEASAGRRLALTRVNVSVSDVNDNSPVFVGRPYRGSVSSSAAPGSLVAKVRAVDRDSGANGHISYSLISDVGGGTLFSVDSRSGAIFWRPLSPFVANVAAKNSSETAAAVATTATLIGNSEYKLFVAARDHGDPALMSQTEVIISVVATNRPRFVHSSHHYTASVDELTPTGYPVLTVQAVAGSQLDHSHVVYVIVPDHNSSRFFNIDLETGVLRVADQLSADYSTLHRLTVAAMDRLTGSAGMTQVTVHVTNVNNHAPRVLNLDSRGRLVVTVSESAHIGISLLNISVTDDDRELHKRFYYRITDDNGCHQSVVVDDESTTSAHIPPASPQQQQQLQVVRVTEAGQLLLAEHVDFERQQLYQLQLEVADDGVPQLFSVVPLLLLVQDVNDNAPKFDSADNTTIQCHVTDLARPGQFVVMATAHDTDTGSRLRYRIISGNDRQHFVINKLTGVIVIGHTRNFARDVTRYTLTVSVSDGVHMSYTNVTVHIVPSNQHAPNFTEAIYSVQLADSAAVGSAVVRVTAIDPDPGRLGHVTYHLTSPLIGELFAVNETTGEISTLVPLKSALLALRLLPVATIVANEERETRLEFVVSASDAGSRSSHCTVRLLVLATQHKWPLSPPRTAPPPLLLVSQYHCTVRDNMTTGDVIIPMRRVRRYGDNREVRYSILESNGSSIKHAVDIDVSSGDVILMTDAQQLEKSVYQFFVRVTVVDDETLTSDVALNMLVMPSDAGSIAFDPLLSGSNVIHLSEAENPGAVVVHLTVVTHGPVALPIVYRLAPGQGPEGPFRLSDRGELVLAERLDRETVDRYDVVVAAETSSLPPLVAYCTLVVLVSDVNDNAPHFDTPLYPVTVSELTQPGSRVIKVKARDIDAAVNGRVTYRLKSSHGQMTGARGHSTGHTDHVTSADLISVFSVDEKSGWLTTLTPLDRELVGEYRLIVEAVDSGSPSLSSHCTVHVLVDDVNDSPMTFAGAVRRSSVTVAEDAPPETLVTVLHIVDPDASVDAALVSYYITDGDADHRFMMKTNSAGNGELMVARQLDRETVADFNLSVVVTDGTFSAETRVHVQVLDANDNAPICPVQSYSVTVPEDSSDQLVLVTVEAFDLDLEVNSRLTYQLFGQGAEMFIIDPNSGAVRLAAALDRETQHEYTLTVVVSDDSLLALTNATTADGSHSSLPPAAAADSCSSRSSLQSASCSCRLTVTVTDVNDCAPEIRVTSLSWSVAEDAAIGHVIGRLEATDHDSGDGGRMVFSLVDTLVSVVQVDNQTGVITLVVQLDREVQDQYTVSVSAADRGSPSLATTAAITLTVTDVNDNPPIFTELVYYGFVPEDAPVDSHVLTVMAASIDIGVNAKLFYCLVSGNELGLFKINAETGVITVGGALDRELVSEFVLTVAAADGSTAPLTGQATVNVTVTDINDLAPHFSRQLYGADVAENEAPGATVLQVFATDGDLHENGTVRYSITSGNELKHFVINSSTGEIYIASYLDREMVAQYEMNVTAADLGQPPLRSMTRVAVLVTDVNDNPPVFTQAEYFAVVREGGPIGVELLHFRPTDADLPPNAAPFTYEIAAAGAHEQAFSIDAAGRLLTAASLSYQRRSQYRLLVRVYDGGDNAMSSETHVNITVVEESRFPPVIVPLSITLVWAGGDFPGAHIGRVHATDQDAHDRLSYALATPLLPPEPLSAECHHCSAPAPRPVACQPVGAPTQLFSVDPLDGAVHAMAGLDAGCYQLNVTVSDGKFVASQAATVSLVDVGESLEHCTLPLIVHNCTARHFALALLAPFQRVLQQTLNLQSNVAEPLSVVVLGVQQLDGVSETGDGPIATNNTPNPANTNTNSYYGSISHTLPRQSQQQQTHDQQQPASADSQHMDDYEDQYEFVGESRRVLPSVDRDLLVDNELNDDRERVLEVLVAAKHVQHGRCMPRAMLRQRIAHAFDQISRAVRVPVESANGKCSSHPRCVHGQCEETIHFSTRLYRHESRMSSFVAPTFVRRAVCRCSQGFTDEQCDRPANPCLFHTCPEFQLCQPLSDNTTSSQTESNNVQWTPQQQQQQQPAAASYVCRCPPGTAGPLCQLSSDHSIQCGGHEAADQCPGHGRGSSDTDVTYALPAPHMSLPFDGSAYLEYELRGEAAFGHRFSAALSVRTRHERAVLLYSAAATEYSVLEIVDGIVRYRFNCGTGEGAVSVSQVHISDNIWHTIRVERVANKAEVWIDEQFSSHAVSPGYYEVVSVPSARLFVGAEVRQSMAASAPNSSSSSSSSSFHWPLLVVDGLVGCVDGLQLFNTAAPLYTEHSTPSVRLVRAHLTGAEQRRDCGTVTTVLPPDGASGVTRHVTGAVLAADAVTADTAAGAVSQQCGRCLNGGKCFARPVGGQQQQQQQQHSAGSPPVAEVSCHCPARYYGQFCQLDRDVCASAPCLNGGTCSRAPDRDAGFQCRCLPDYGGRQCQFGGACSASPCRNGARCEEGVASAICLCRGGFTGRHCELDIDECSTQWRWQATTAAWWPRQYFSVDTNALMVSAPAIVSSPSTSTTAAAVANKTTTAAAESSGACLNGATCVNTPGSYRCVCGPEWGGARCSEPAGVSVASDAGGGGGGISGWLDVWSGGGGGGGGLSALWLLLAHVVAALALTVCTCLLIAAAGALLCRGRRRRWSRTPQGDKFAAGLAAAAASNTAALPSPVRDSCAGDCDDDDADCDVSVDTASQVLLHSFKQQVEEVQQSASLERRTAAAAGHVQYRYRDRERNRLTTPRPSSQHKLICVGIPAPQSDASRTNDQQPRDQELKPLGCEQINSSLAERSSADETTPPRNQPTVYPKPTASVAPSVMAPVYRTAHSTADTRHRHRHRCCTPPPPPLCDTNSPDHSPHESETLSCDGKKVDSTVAVETSCFSSASLRRKLARCNSAFIDNYSLFKPASDDDIVPEMAGAEKWLPAARWRCHSHRGTCQPSDPEARRRPLSAEVATSDAAIFRSFGMLPGIVSALSAASVGGQQRHAGNNHSHVTAARTDTQPAVSSHVIQLGSSLRSVHNNINNNT